MKKTYIAPATENIELKNQVSLLVNSVVLNPLGQTEIVDSNDIIDTSGVLEPDAREFGFEDEDFSDFE